MILVFSGNIQIPDVQYMALNKIKCDVYSTTGALEAAYAQAFGKGISLSEQQLVDCAGAFNNFGCNGGLPSQAFEYIKYIGGLETEAAYPYTGKDGVCKYSSENAVVQVLDSVNITLVRWLTNLTGPSICTEISFI